MICKVKLFESYPFQKIIHIIDTGGAVISDDRVGEDLFDVKAEYTPTEIRTANVEGMRHRNDVKSQCLNRLTAAQKIWGIPYQVYYMSCNPDPALHAKQNALDEEKEKDALACARQYRQGMHSLERCTNLGFCLRNRDDSETGSSADGLDA